MNLLPLLLSLAELMIALNERGMLTPDETAKLKAVRDQIADLAEARLNKPE